VPTVAADIMPAESELHVLVAEDEAVSRLLLTGLLESWGYRVSIARDGDEAWQILQSPDWPLLAVLDWVMPGMDGIDICRRLRADPHRRHAYVIMITSNDATSDLVTALEAGADDFVAKPFDVDELRVRLRAGQRIVDLQRELHRKASHDDLTGMFNRRMVVEMLAREHARALREKGCLSVGMLDIDYFKPVNDSFGHHAGDAVLQEVARRINASVREIDITGRYGGEEFLLVLPGCDATAAAVIAERVRSLISATPMTALEHEIHVTASIGVVTSTSPPGADPQTLIADADRALYRAKARGRNRVDVGGGDPPA
jgi:two-component system cell cycle response regulator